MPSGAYPYNMDLHEDQLLQPVPIREFFRLSLLGDARDSQLLTELDMHGEIRKSERGRQTFPLKSQIVEGHDRTLNESSLYNHEFSSSLRSVQSDVPIHSLLSDEYVNHVPGNHMGSSYNEKRAYKIPPVLIDSSSRNIDTSSLNDIIEETWELPSLFRRGPTVDSNKSENLTWYLNSSEKRRKVISGIRSTDDRGWSPTWEGSLSDWSLQLDTSGLRETDSSWNEIVLPKKSMKRKLSSIDKDKERHVSDLQMSVRKKVVQFFENCSDDDNSDDSCVDSDSDVPSTIIGTSDEGKSKEERAFEFFLHMIGENNELKKLYNAQCYGDEIECLVCSSIPGKLPKKYNGLISVIKHANKILKTKRRQEHRGYAHAMCVAMGWDLQRLRSVTQCSSPHTRCCIP